MENNTPTTEEIVKSLKRSLPGPRPERLTKEQSRIVRSLVEDSGYTRREARILAQELY